MMTVGETVSIDDIQAEQATFNFIGLQNNETLVKALQRLVG